MSEMNRHENVIQFNPKRKQVLGGITAGVVVLLLILLLTCFRIEEIQVTGNKHYTKEQIEKFVLSRGYIDNTILLMLKNKLHPIKDIPFIAKLDVEYVDAHKITVTVYEKAMAGCVEYMNEYVYFDQDGYVLEISSTKLSDTPCVTGMYFTSMELHEKLPIEDENRFKTILKLTQLIQKHELQIEAIQFTSEDEIVLQYEKIRIELGMGNKLEEQLTDLDRILAGLDGKKGILDMRDFDSASGTASFKLDTEKKNEKQEDKQGKEDSSATENSEENTTEAQGLDEAGGYTTEAASIP